MQAKLLNKELSLITAITMIYLRGRVQITLEFYNKIKISSTLEVMTVG